MIQNFSLKFKDGVHARSFEFAKKVILLVDSMDNKPARWIMGNQLLRSSTSIGANLFEAKAASSRLDFKKYLEISLKSANETKFWLALLQETQIIKPQEIEFLQKEVDEIAKILGRSILTLKNKL